MATGAFVLAVAGSASGRTIKVDTNSGALAEDGDCSLPEAIIAANEDDGVEACRAGDGKDLIAFDLPGSPVIQPAEQLPDITRPVVIDGKTEPDFVSSPVVQIQEDVPATGIEIPGNHVTVRGLQILDFTFEGVRIEGQRNKIVGNLIGINAASQDHGNGSGILLEGDHNQIGGKVPAKRNVISGNDFGSGVSAAGDGNVIQGNYIGTQVSGNGARANAGNGVTSNGSGTKITGNTISGNGLNGVSASGSDGKIQGNVIGLDSTANGSVANGSDGVAVLGSDWTIGGSEPSKRNVISANGDDGVSIATATQAGRNHVLGNYIGTDGTGTVPRGNQANGVRIGASAKNVIGGDEPSEANVIADSVVGVRLGQTTMVFDPTKKNVVSGNLIGTDVTGEEDLGNESGAVRLQNGARDNVIGGLGKGEGNVMRFTPGGAVSIGGNTSSFDNSILGNEAFDNGEEVIDLGEEGITANDPSPDADTGPNRLQNFPVLLGGNQQQDKIFGSLDSAPDQLFRIEFFLSDATGDAQHYLGQRAIETDGAGHDDFSFKAARNLPQGDFVTATATVLKQPGDKRRAPAISLDRPGDTSELSASADVSLGP